MLDKSIVQKNKVKGDNRIWNGLKNTDFSTDKEKAGAPFLFLIHLFSFDHKHSLVELVTMC